MVQEVAVREWENIGLGDGQLGHTLRKRRWLTKTHSRPGSSRRVGQTHDWEVVTLRKHGFTLIELLVVIAIIAILAAILFPVFAKAREKARQTACLNNEKQIVLAIIQYTDDWRGVFPIDETGASPNRIPWHIRVLPYHRNTEVYMCDSNIYNNDFVRDTHQASWTAEKIPTSYYGTNNVIKAAGSVLLLSEVKESATTACMIEGGQTRDPQANLRGGTAWTAAQVRDRLYAGHNGGFNVPFCDGHAKWMKPTASTSPCVWAQAPSTEAADPAVVTGMQDLEAKFG